MPPEWGFWSARRYVSLFKPGQSEDVFPYYRPGARWSALQSVRAPVAALIGGRDEFLDRGPGELIDAFRQHATRTARFTGIVVAGATHGFQGYEKPLATALLDWLHDSLSL